MFEQLIHIAIGAVYCVVFACKVRNSGPCPLLALLRNLPAEDHCHLALGILYPLSALHI
ncbi:MAG: hypothetical protein WA793_11870 [Sphingorhabdus sp.]|uniref:hypothetical protein n=1 Tax=Sphingorhabdus sp. TaxID=1902408 RepID=UPI003CC0796A